MEANRLDHELDSAPIAPAAATAPVPFRGLLGIEEIPAGELPAPTCFRDLNLDRVVEAIVKGREEYGLVGVLHTALQERSVVEYRHQVFRELEDDAFRKNVAQFSEQMARMRRLLNLSMKQHYKYERERWLLDSARLYCEAVVVLNSALDEAELSSEAFRAFRSWVASYASSDAFTRLVADSEAVLAQLDSVVYAFAVNGLKITVAAYAAEPDYSKEVEKTFERFRQADTDPHLVKVPDSGSMDHVEANIVNRVARLFRDEFRSLDSFCASHAAFVDGTLARFDRELQFFLAYIEFMRRAESTGACFSYPSMGEGDELSADGGCDIALAQALLEREDGGRIVRNDFALTQPERILVVSGPNQGGKTTFARMFGQLHYLASLGVPVPAVRARLFLPDEVFTHFEREEDISTLRGKLDDELVRIRDILAEASERSVIVVNEIFASTTLADAVQLGTSVVGDVIALGCPALFVTFVDELASLGPATVSMVAVVQVDDPTKRTFKIARRPADGRAYALALAEKYGLSYAQLRRRIGG